VLALPVASPLKYRELLAGMRETIAHGIFVDESPGLVHLTEIFQIALFSLDF